MIFHLHKIQRFGIPLSISLGYATCASNQPNVLWITSEDNETELGRDGDTYSNTLNIDRLTIRFVRFRRCWSSAPACAPQVPRLFLVCMRQAWARTASVAESNCLTTSNDVRRFSRLRDTIVRSIQRWMTTLRTRLRNGQFYESTGRSRCRYHFQSPKPLTARPFAAQRLGL